MLLRRFIGFLSASLCSATVEQAPLKSDAVTFPWVRRFASIGDSYSAGLGAGDRIDWACSRYARSYPNILHTTLLGHDDSRKHQFLACSGATSTMILETQVPALEEEIDLLTISAGGNDIGLTPILNNCVYQFYMAGESDCETSIENARRLIANETQLSKNITLLIDAVKPKMNQAHGVIYVTGYAGFFGAEDRACDNVTWAVWSSIESTAQHLTLELRATLDELVRSVNDVLRAVTQAAGPNVRFINYNADVAAVRGRYCESGVLEPAPNRVGLLFYEWNSVDTGEDPTEVRNRTGDDVPRGSFEGDIAELVNKTLEEHPEWEFDPDKGFVNKSSAGFGSEGAIEDAIHWMLPDAWKRVFHLRPEGHAVVAQMLVKDLWEKGRGGRWMSEVEEL